MEEVLAKSRIISLNENGVISDKVSHPDNWWIKFSPGETQVLYPLYCRTANYGYFTPDKSADPQKIKNLIREIDLGIWDSCLLWDYDAYRNIQSQNEIGDFIRKFQTTQNLHK